MRSPAPHRPRSTCASAGPRARCCSIRPLSSPRFTIRPLAEDDAAALYELREWFGADDLDALRARISGWESRRSPDESERWLNWLVLDDAPAAWVQATIRPDMVLIAYAVLPARRGEGIATEAVVAVTSWLHEHHPVVEAHIADDNFASQAVARRSGFVRTGRTSNGEAVWQHTS
jgi:RimJ/RimL family protein N-acetyltransferase